MRGCHVLPFLQGLHTLSILSSLVCSSYLFGLALVLSLPAYLRIVVCSNGLPCSKLAEVNEEFIQQYNLADAFEEKERFEDVARTMLERIKVCGMRKGITLRFRA